MFCTRMGGHYTPHLIPVLNTSEVRAASTELTA